MEAALEDAPIVKLVNAIMTQAVGDRASDVHIEPAEKNVRIRFRVDGVLHEPMPPAPKNIQGGLISPSQGHGRAEHRREARSPGRPHLDEGRRQGSSTCVSRPCRRCYGEKVVIRVLDKSQALLKLEDLGFLEESYKRFAKSFSKPYGAILVTGPTGSGKSTTMYSTLNILNEDDKNIITVEDPVEYRLAGVNQMQVNPKAGLTFASALRSILRADPDIVLIGEIRDKETATIAIEAALTGHLVLSSLHTNDAPSAITRLTEMDVETFLVASAIDSVVAQRLARKLCERCKVAYQPEEAELHGRRAIPEWLWPEITQIYKPQGCAACANTGYRGRMGLYEVMPMTEEIERLTVERASSESIKTVAMQQGMITLRDDGLEKVRMGITSIEEVARVVK